MSDERMPDDPATRPSDNVAVGDPDTQWRQATQRHYDPDDTGELSSAIVYAIADAEGIEARELKHPPLYECVDAAALEETFFGPEYVGGPSRSVGGVEFRYRDYLVTVDSDGWIQVYEPTDDGRG